MKEKLQKSSLPKGEIPVHNWNKKKWGTAKIVKTLPTPTPTKVTLHKAELSGGSNLTHRRKVVQLMN